MKKVQIDTNLNDFKISQEIKITEFIKASKKDIDEFKVSSNMYLESIRNEITQNLTIQNVNIEAIITNYSLKNEMPSIVENWF